MAEEAPMVEMEERVDLDGDNYNEEMDDEVEEPLEEDNRVDGDVVGENAEEEDQEAFQTEEHEKDPLPEANGHPDIVDPVADEEKLTPSIGEDDKEKHAELLSLPPHGSEVFVGGIPRDVTEVDLRDHFESIGEVTEMRVIKDKDTGERKGYVFVTFKTKECAQKAIEEIHNKEFKGKTLRCSLSQTKYRLFMGNIPKSWTDEDLRAVIEKTGPGVEHIDLVKDPQNPGRNRGFAFIEYYNNACADYSRQKMVDPQFKLEGNIPTVTWAEPKSAPDPSSTSQVKCLYVKNLPESITNEKLKELFQRHGEVTKVVLPPSKSGQSKREYGFIHYAERASAQKAVKESEKYEIDGTVLEVYLAKPQNEKKYEQVPSYGQGPFPGYLPQPSYGFADPYGGLGAYGGAGGFQQPMIYGRGPMPAGMQMVPMMLPDGRLGYVLQQPGAQAPPPPPRRHERRNDRSSGSHGREDSPGSDGNRGRRYRPY